MAEKELVSVILPTYNRARTLPTAARSVLAQTHSAFELIIVDDGSVDGTEDAVSKLQDPRVRYERLDGNRGANAARNRGVELANGRFVAFQDSDDEWRPQKIARQLRTLMKAGDAVGVCVASYRLHKEGKVKTVRHAEGTVAGEDVIRRLVSGIAYGTVTLLVRRSTLIEAGGFDERLPRRQDLELCLRLARRTAFTFVGDVLVDAHYSADSVSLDPEKFLKATELILSAHADIFAQHRRGHSFQLYEAGKYLALAGQKRRGFALSFEAMRTSPLNWRAWVLAATIATGTTALSKRLRG